MSVELKHEAAGLLLEKAIDDLHQSLHAGDTFDGWRKHNSHIKNGEELAKRVGLFINRIENAVKHYERCREFFNESKP